MLLYGCQGDGAEMGTAECTVFREQVWKWGSSFVFVPRVSKRVFSHAKVFPLLSFVICLVFLVMASESDYERDYERECRRMRDMAERLEILEKKLGRKRKREVRVVRVRVVMTRRMTREGEGARR